MIEVNCPSSLNYQVYTQMNCETERLSKRIQLNCLCVPFFLPRLSETTHNYIEQKLPVHIIVSFQLQKYGKGGTIKIIMNQVQHIFFFYMICIIEIFNFK